MNKRPRTFFSLGVIALVLAVFVIVVSIRLRPPSLVIAFNAMPQKTHEALVNTITEYNTSLAKPYKLIFNTVEDTSFSRALADAKTDIAFTFSGIDADAAVSLAQRNNAGFSESILQDMTVSVQQSALVKNNAVFAVPLLMDHLEISLSQSALSFVGGSTFYSLQDLADFLTAAKNVSLNVHYPLVFNGSDDQTLTNIFGALTESLYGKSPASELAALIRDGATFQQLLARSGDSDALKAFRAALDLLKDWYNTGIISDITFQMQETDILAFMENSQCAAVIMPLSFHRTIPVRFYDKYPESICFPSQLRASERGLTAPVLYAIPLAKSKKKLRAALEIVSFLETPLTQGKLSSRSGLAPVLGRAETPDIQADDVRFWVASTNAPLANLSDAAFAGKTSLASIASSLREYVTQR
jgi:hypothetical protein